MPVRYIQNGAPTTAFSITPNDDDDLAVITQGILVPTTGDVAVIMADDTVSVILPDLAVGVFYPFRIKRVLDTGTEPTTVIGFV